MAKIKLDFKTKSVTDKIEKSEYYVGKLTNNVNFANPSPALADVSAAINALKIARTNAADGGKTLKAIERQKEAELDNIVTLLSEYIQAESKGDELKILSAGMDIRKKAAPIGDLLAPENLTVENDKTSGAINLKWDSVKGKSSYLIEYSQDVTKDDAWGFAGVSTSTKFTKDKLKPGTKYSFRVAAVGAAGQSAWSNEAEKMVI